MSSADLPAPAVVPPPPVPRTLLRWVATSNPFYVISAGLFLFGLRVSFGDPARDTDAWALTGGLAGYTLLLAAAALLLVRYARVWDDVRTVLLLVVLMFLATSVTFDELLAVSPARGVLLNAAGLVFACGVSEGVLRCIRLRLPAGFRVPYYLTLALFFLYPVALVPLLRDPHGEALMWGLWGFSPAAGLVFLTLVPAVRRGPGSVRVSGSPWPWPYYPWSLFVFLGFAVAGRSFLLCWSLHLLGGGDAGRLVFGPYFLVPFGFAVAVLVVELGVVSRHRPTQWVALLLPVGLVALAGAGHNDDPIAAEFLGTFAARLGGSPLFLTLLAAGVFYLFAWVRQVPFASEGLTAVLVALAFVGPDTFTLRDARGFRVAPLVAAWALQLGIGLWTRDVWRWGLAGGAPAVWVGLEGWRWYAAARAAVAGLDYLVAGLLTLPFAVAVSLVKSGVVRRWVAARREREAVP